MLTGCGTVNKAINNTKTQFKLNGVELMETTTCTWGEYPLTASLVVKEYSDGSVDKAARVNTPGLIGFFTVPLNDMTVIHYAYYDMNGIAHYESLVGDSTTCRSVFTPYE